MKTIIINLILLTCSLTFAGCSGDSKTETLPETLRIGVLPDESPEKLRSRYEPLFDYVSKQLKRDYVLVIPEDYNELLEKFKNKELDLAYFGGVTFLRAQRDYGAVPVVMRDTDLRFTSYILASADDERTVLQDFIGASFSFGSKLSTSGHLMPRYFMEMEGIEPESFFSKVLFSGKHDKTAYNVRDGLVELGAANSKIVDTMFRDGRLAREQIRIVYETPSFVDYVWAMQPDYMEKCHLKIVNAFLSLNPASLEHETILSAVDARGFLPASDNDFAMLKSVFIKQGFKDN